MSPTGERGGIRGPIAWLALAAVAATGLLLAPPLFVSHRSGPLRLAVEGSVFTAAAMLAAIALLGGPGRTGSRPRAASFSGAGLAAVAVSTLLNGLVVPLAGGSFGRTSYPAVAWAAGWVIAAAAFAPRLPSGRRPHLVAGIAVLGVVVADGALWLGRSTLSSADLASLASGDRSPFAGLTPLEALPAAAAVILLAWAGLRERGDDGPSRWRAGALFLAAAAQVVMLARPVAFRPVVQPADALRVLVLGAWFAGVLLERRAGPVTLEGEVREGEVPEHDVARTRAALASMVAHELRNPLMSVKGLASTGARLYDTMTDEERREFFETIDAESARLKEIVDETSTALKIDAGEIDYLLREESLSDLVEEAAWDTHVKDHPLMVEVEPDLTVACDRARVTEVVAGLVSNAGKFSPPQEPIAVRAFRRPDGAAVVEVIDRGPGIPPEERERVFEKFARYRPPGYEQVQGAGLGLFIARAHVAAHGGRLTLDSGEGTGTIARFTFPTDEAR